MGATPAGAFPAAGHPWSPSGEARRGGCPEGGAWAAGREAAGATAMGLGGEEGRGYAGLGAGPRASRYPRPAVRPLQEPGGSCCRGGWASWGGGLEGWGPQRAAGQQRAGGAGCGPGRWAAHATPHSGPGPVHGTCGAPMGRDRRFVYITNQAHTGFCIIPLEQ